MAHSIDRFLRQNPKHQMVVIAGAGHIAYGSGIPKRTYRLNGKEYVTLLNAKSGGPRKGFADYVLFPEPLSAPAAPLLGIYIEKKDKGIMIKGFSPGSVAQKAGIKKEDYLRSIDGMKIIDIVDPKISLFSQKKGETIPVKILRKRFMLPDREITFKVKLR
jgi:predicted metalloprotease with PDZ domain